MNALTFKTPDVAQLYEDIRGCCHPEYPFLDPNYSPGANAPAVDLTPWVAACLTAGHEDAVAELWNLLTYPGDASAYALRQALKAHLPSWIRVSAPVSSELHAIYILTMRAAMCVGAEHMPSVAARLAATTLACTQMDIDANYIETFRGILRSEIGDHSILDSPYGRTEGVRLAVETALSPFGAAEFAAAKLRMVPPMARLVVYDFFYRGWGEGLRFNLYYDERMYGCGASWNQHYVEWLEFFAPPSDTAQVPAAVTKEMLAEALEEKGIRCKKSTTRKEMIEQARGISGLLSSLILRTRPEQCELRSEWAESLRTWADRVRSIESVGAAIIKLMALTAMGKL